MNKLPIPTGYLFTDDYSKGQLETLSIGDYGKHHNVKADFLGYNRPLNGVANTMCMPLSEKWVVTLSTQYGCQMNCTFCFTPDTKILMADRTEKNIADIIVGDKVISYNTNTKLEEISIVSHLYVTSHNGILYNIILEDGTVLRITGNHPVLVKNGIEEVWVNAEHLTTNMDAIKVF